MGFERHHGTKTRDTRALHVPKFVILDAAGRYWTGDGWTANAAGADVWLDLGACEAAVRKVFGPHGVLPGAGTVRIVDIGENATHQRYGSA